MNEVPVLDLLTEREAAELLAVQPVTLRAWRYRGLAPPHLRLPSLGVNDAYAIRYRAVDVETFIATTLAASRVTRPKGHLR